MFTDRLVFGNQMTKKEKLDELHFLQRSFAKRQNNLDQWWREMETYKVSVEELLDMMPKEPTVLRSIMMLFFLQLCTNMLGRQLDEIEERLHV